MKIINANIILLLLLMGLACAKESNETVTKKSTAQQLQKVGVVYPKENTFSSDVSITGTAMPYQMVKIQAMESGFVQSISKDIGDYVVKGGLIARLQNPELLSKLKESEARLKNAAANILQQEAEQKKWTAVSQAKKSILDRIANTYKKAPNIVMAADVDNARAEYEIAHANQAGAEAGIAAAIGHKDAAKAIHEAMKARVGMLVIRAPFSGIITKRFVDNGATILSALASANSQAIVVMQNVSKIRLTVHLPEADAATIEVGSLVKISFPEISDESRSAKVSRTSNTLDPDSKTMQVEIDLDNKDGKIKPGMYAKVQLNAQSRKGKLSVPIAAKKLIDDIPHILIVKDGLVKALKLSQGLEGRDFFEILNSRVGEQTQIIIQGKNLVKDGQKVEATILN